MHGQCIHRPLTPLAPGAAAVDDVPVRTLTAVLIGSLLVLSAGPARAYCRTSTTSTPDHDGHVCAPPQASDSGAPIAWYMPRITYSVQQDASQDVPFEAAQAAVRAAFDTWMSADCGGEPPRIELIEGDAAVCAGYDYNKERANANVIFFVDQGWADEPEKLAVTTVTFNKNTGEIYDADMGLNSTDWTFTTTGAAGGMDLLSVLTHEAGHFLGLAHSAAPDATMNERYSPPEVQDLRSLAADDNDGICAIYPPAPIAEECDATPRHGFSPLCGAEQPAPEEEEEPAADRCCCTDGYECVDGACVEGGCSCTTAPSVYSPWSILWPAGAALAFLQRRRRKVPGGSPQPPARPGRAAGRGLRRRAE